MDTRNTLVFRQRVGLIILVIEIFFTFATFVFGLRYGMDQISETIQWLAYIIGITIITIIAEAFWRDHDRRSVEEHSGTYQEYKT